MEKTINNILSHIKNYLSEEDVQRVSKAFEYSKKIYGDKKTPWGIEYTKNYLETAYQLLELHPDMETLCACFLQKTPSFDLNALVDIETEFRKNVLQLVKNLHEINNMSEKKDQTMLLVPKEFNQTITVDVLRRMFLAMAKDLRVILVHLAEKVNLMKNISVLEKKVRKPYAQEVLDIFVPIADRLGIFQFKRMLEDLCFGELEREQYKEIKTQFDKDGKTFTKSLEIMKKTIKAFLKEHEIEVAVEGRIKGHYSTYQKMKKKNFSHIDKVLDLFAIRVIIDKQEDCYRVLGLMHNQWQPIPGKFKDYISAPKVNGYRSLHTIVTGLAKEVYTKPVEIQIRTQEMHREAEFGIAAHWWYKEAPVEKRTFADNLKDSKDKVSKNFEEKLQWVKNLVDLHENLKNSNEEFSDSLKLNLFSDRIFVLTPHGDVKDLPRGATPIDFAYEIHTNLGNHCVRAKVNGENVPLDYELKNGDNVEIMTDTKKTPNRYWLSFVKTTKAREKIRAWIKSLKSEDSLKEGKKLLNKHLKNLNKPLLDSENLLLRDFGDKRLTVKEREEILEDIGKGSLSPMAVLKKLFPREVILRKRVESLKWKDKKAPKKTNTPKILITGESGYETKLSNCCKPQPGQPIVGYTTRGGVISIHRHNCGLLSGLANKRLLRASWEGYVAVGVGTLLRVVLSNTKNNALYEISRILREEDIEILDFNKLKEGEDAILTFQVEVVDYEQLDLLINKLEELECVNKIENVLALK